MNATLRPLSFCALFILLAFAACARNSPLPPPTAVAPASAPALNPTVEEINLGMFLLGRDKVVSDLVREFGPCTETFDVNAHVAVYRWKGIELNVRHNGDGVRAVRIEAVPIAEDDQRDRALSRFAEYSEACASAFGMERLRWRDEILPSLLSKVDTTCDASFEELETRYTIRRRGMPRLEVEHHGDVWHGETPRKRGS